MTPPTDPLQTSAATQWTIEPGTITNRRAVADSYGGLGAGI